MTIILVFRLRPCSILAEPGVPLYPVHYILFSLRHLSSLSKLEYSQTQSPAPACTSAIAFPLASSQRGEPSSASLT